MQASAAKITWGEGSTGPKPTINATPAKPHTQPTSLRTVRVSSFSQAAQKMPNTTAVVLSSALYPAGSCRAAQANNEKGSATDKSPSKINSRQCLSGQRWRITRIKTASVTVAKPMRSAAMTLGPSNGLAMRISMKEAPHRADSAMSCAKYLVFTSGRLWGTACASLVAGASVGR